MTRATFKITKVENRTKSVLCASFRGHNKHQKVPQKAKMVKKRPKYIPDFVKNGQKIINQIYLRDRSPGIFLSIWQGQFVRSLGWQTESKSFPCASFRGLYVSRGASCVLISISARVTARPILYCPSLCSEKEWKIAIL